MSESVNGKLFLEPYAGAKKLEMKVQSGFGVVKARANLIGLKLLKDAFVIAGQHPYRIAANSIVYFNEDVLISNESYRNKLSIEGDSTEFVIGNYHDVAYIKGLDE